MSFEEGVAVIIAVRAPGIKTITELLVSTNSIKYM